MERHRRFAVSAIVLLAGGPLGCGGSGGGGGHGGASTSEGGATSSSGGRGTGGLLGSGGTNGSGGMIGSGGMTGTGGRVASGGAGGPTIGPDASLGGAMGGGGTTGLDGGIDTGRIDAGRIDAGGVDAPAGTGLWSMGYYASWKAEQYPIAEIEWAGLTHIAMAFYLPQQDGSMTLLGGDPKPRHHDETRRLAPITKAIPQAP